MARFAVQMISSGRSSYLRLAAYRATISPTEARPFSVVSWPMASGDDVPNAKPTAAAARRSRRRISLETADSMGHIPKILQSDKALHLSLIGLQTVKISCTRQVVRCHLLIHLRHQRAIFAVMHSDVLAQRRANVRP